MKSRTRGKGTETSSVNIFSYRKGKNDRQKVIDACKAFACDPWIAIYIESSEIADLFEGYRAEEESTVEAEVVSAVELSDAQKTDIANGLKKRLGREVTLQCSIDESLIGGAIIRAGDLVIDGSITSQLSKLGHALSR